MWRVTLRSEPGAEPVEIELERTDAAHAEAFSARRGNEHLEIEVERTGPGSGWLRVRGRIVPFHAVRLGNVVEVWTPGQTHALEVVDRQARRARAGGETTATDRVTAPMPGTITKVNVSVGDTFAAHAPLIIMESMKMEMTLSAPHAGRIKELRCGVGELVPMGQILVKLAPLEETNAAS